MVQEIFQHIGNLPAVSNLLNKFTIGSNNLLIPYFINSLGTRSIPGCLLFFSFRIPLRNSAQLKGKSNGPTSDKSCDARSK